MCYARFFPPLTVCFGFYMLPVTAAEEYEFDISAYESKTYEFGGYVESYIQSFDYNTSAALYELNFYNQDKISDNQRLDVAAQLEAKYRKNEVRGYMRFNPSAYVDEVNDDVNFDLHEAYVSWQQGTAVSFDLGKKLIKWGKGYAWNPVGFIERVKDPNEPDLAREGYSQLGADWIVSPGGSLQTVAFTPVYLPVREDINSDFGEDDDNLAGKLYLLYKDMDIDFMFLTKASKSSRIGADLSRNISTNFEIHAEWARVFDADRVSLNPDGALSSKQVDTDSWLLGMRYLTESEATVIAEYYRNGLGLDANSASNFFRLIKQIPEQQDSQAAYQLIKSLTQQGFADKILMREYLYIRFSQQNPFDYLYFFPSLALIYNLEDESYVVSPSLSYTGIDNMEIRGFFSFLFGDDYSEFGEKQNKRRLEFKVRYAF